MRSSFRTLLALGTVGAVLSLTACGGSDSASSTSTATSSTTTATVTPSTTTPGSTLTYSFPLSGITFNLAGLDSVHVPPGTTVQSANGSATLGGSYGILYTGASATVTVPANPTAAATNLVSTATPVSGAAYLGPAVVSALMGSATATTPQTDGLGAAAILAGNGRLTADPYGNIYSNDGGGLKSVKANGQLSTLVAANAPYSWQAMAADGADNVYGQGLSVTAPSGQSALSIHVRKQNGSLVTVAENWTSTATPESNFATNGIAVTSAGVLYAVDAPNHRVVKFSSTGVPQVIAGSGTTGLTDGTGTAARFNNPTALAVDSNGNVYVADTGNHAVRKISASGVVQTIALTGNPGPIAVDSVGNVYCMASAPVTLVRIAANLSVITATVLPGLPYAVSGIAVVPDGTVYVAATTSTGGAQIYRVTR